jgi:hypothetical protein
MDDSPTPRTRVSSTTTPRTPTTQYSQPELSPVASSLITGNPFHWIKARFNLFFKWVDKYAEDIVGYTVTSLILSGLGCLLIAIPCQVINDRKKESLMSAPAQSEVPITDTAEVAELARDAIVNTSGPIFRVENLEVPPLNPSPYQAFFDNVLGSPWVFSLGTVCLLATITVLGWLYLFGRNHRSSLQLSHNLAKARREEAYNYLRQASAKDEEIKKLAAAASPEVDGPGSSRW